MNLKNFVEKKLFSISFSKAKGLCFKMGSITLGKHTTYLDNVNYVLIVFKLFQISILRFNPEEEVPKCFNIWLLRMLLGDWVETRELGFVKHHVIGEYGYAISRIPVTKRYNNLKYFLPWVKTKSMSYMVLSNDDKSIFTESFFKSDWDEVGYVPTLNEIVNTSKGINKNLSCIFK